MTFRGLLHPAMLLVVGVLFGTALGFQAFVRAYQINLSKRPIYAEGDRKVAAIPRETESWMAVGPDRIESADVVDVLGTQNYVQRVYVPKDGREIGLDFHAAYYTNSIDTVPHVPERCFVGGGLQKANVSRVMDVPMPERVTELFRPDRGVPPESAGEGGVLYRTTTSRRYSDAPGVLVRLPRGVTPDRPLRMNVSEFVTPGGERRLFAGYFFIANGGTVARAEEVRALAFDLSSDYAYYMKVQVTSGSVSSAEELAEAAGSLVGELLPEIMRCVPDWVEVEAGRYPPATGVNEES